MAWNAKNQKVKKRNKHSSACEREFVPNIPRNAFQWKFQNFQWRFTRAEGVLQKAKTLFDFTLIFRILIF